MRYCIHCGMPMEDDDLFCTRCGKQVGDAAGERPGNHREEKEAFSAGNDGAFGFGRPAGNDDAFGFGRPAGNDDAFGYGEYEEEDGGSLFSVHQGEKPDRSGNLVFMIACAVIVVAVLGILLILLVRPGGDKDAESPQEQAAAYEEDEDDADGQNLQQAAAEPGSMENQASSSSEEEGGDAPASQGAPAGENSGSADADGNGAGAGYDEEQAGHKEGVEENSSGWVIDEDGNEIYYPAEGEEYIGNDQTEVGGDYTGGSGAADQQNVSGQGVQTQSAGESRQADGGQGQDALQGSEEAGTDSSYILPESASRNYSRGEVEALDNWTLQMAINEIYARHGRKFDTPEIRTYFEGKSWYRGTIDPAAFDGNESAYFNQYEMNNRELLTKIRAEREAASGTAAGSGR